MLKVLVVCTANICRSPVAAALLTHLLQNRQIEVTSVGTRAIAGREIDSTMLSLMNARGFPGISAHRSRGMLPSHVAGADLILCMEWLHLDQIGREYSASVGRSMLLGHWDGKKEVVDPYGGPLDEYIVSLDIIQKYCQSWAKKMIAMGLVA